ncbi:hypothetical protein D1007_49634 [Hordeum vulgare]|nr:hypothetical protein D1007_49634 [Hordeum vulgare]
MAYAQAQAQQPPPPPQYGFKPKYPHHPHAGPLYAAPMQQYPPYPRAMPPPQHQLYGRHSRASSVRRFSGILRGGSGRKGGGDLKAVNAKGWPECSVIEEEGSYEGLSDGDSGLSGRCKVALGFVRFLLLFTVICLIVWGAARPYELDVVVKVVQYPPCLFHFLCTL